MTLSSPLLHIPLKSTESVDFAPSIRDYIRSAYGEDADKYAHEIASLNKLRQDTLGIGKDMTGRDILYRYYGQLELLELRFPINEQNVKVLFTWQDAFTDNQVSQYSVAFEKASVIFNIGAVCSAIAALQNRSDPNGQKIAYNYFQAAAGMLQFINDNFLHPPSKDLSRESIKTLVDVLLAQAQECFIEKVVLDKKKGGIVSKLAAHASQAYNEAIEGILNDELSGQFDVTWLELLKIKAKYFQSLAHMHRAIQLEAEGKYGECVANYNQSEILAKEASKLADNFAYQFPNFTIITMTTSSSSSANGQTMSVANTLVEMTKTLLAQASEGKRIATKDNDVIYHESVPAALDPLEKMNAVKCIPFTDICPKPELAKIIGPDLFQRLIPMAVHESASVYSEEKAKILRDEQNKVEAANNELQATFESLDLISTLDKLKKLAKGDDAVDDHYSLPSDVKSWCEQVRREEVDSAGTSITELTNILNSMKTKIRENLHDSSLQLDKEQHECEQMRVKYMDKWTQEPSAGLTIKLKNDLQELKNTFEKALATDQGLTNRLNDVKQELEMMKLPLVELESVFAESISSAGKPKTQNQTSLLDMSPEDESFGGLGEQVLFEKLDAMVLKLRELKKERSALIEEFKNKVHNEDISQALVLNRGKEKQLFEAEIAKFTPYQQQISTNIQTHLKLLKDLSTDFTRLKSSSKGTKVLAIRDKLKKDLIVNFSRAYEAWKDVRSSLRSGIEFYTDLGDAVDKSFNSAMMFVKSRVEQRNNLVKSIEMQQADSAQQALREQMNRLSLQSQTQTSVVSPTAPAMSPYGSQPPQALPPAPTSLPQYPQYQQQQIPTFSNSNPSTQYPSLPPQTAPQVPGGYLPPQPNQPYRPDVSRPYNPNSNPGFYGFPQAPQISQDPYRPPIPLHPSASNIYPNPTYPPPEVPSRPTYPSQPPIPSKIPGNASVNPAYPAVYQNPPQPYPTLPGQPVYQQPYTPQNMSYGQQYYGYQAPNPAQGQQYTASQQQGYQNVPRPNGNQNNSLL